jgi:hypothetical protein
LKTQQHKKEKKMGRNYTGDIEGQYWTAMQSSDSAAQFGGRHDLPDTIHSFFDQNDLIYVENHLDICKEFILKIPTITDEGIALLNKAFESSSTDNIDELLELHKLKEMKSHEDSSIFGDIELGLKIRNCLKKKRTCTFESEC